MSGEQPMQFNILNEITKLAAIKATSGLSKMLGFPIGVNILPVESKNLDEIQTLMNADEKIVGLTVPIVGQLPGACLFIYPEKSAFAICDIMFHRKDGETKSFSEMEKSALTEVANIIAGNFLTSFSMSLQIESLMHRAAHFEHRKFSEFMEAISNSLYKSVKSNNAFEIAFQFQNSQVQGTAIFLFEEKEVLRLIQKVSA